MLKKTLFLFFFFFLSGASRALPAPGVEGYLYEESRGESRQAVHWLLERADLYHLTYRTPGETNLTTTDPAWNTTEWRCKSPEERTEITARREDNRIHLTGHLNGQVIDRELDIDAAPWFQAASLSLRRLILSDEKEVIFWTLRAGTLDAYKLLAEKQGEETVSILGNPEKATHITLRPTGWRASLYRSDFWFRTSDGVLLHVTSPTGPPGSPTMMLDYRGLSD